MKNRRVIIAIIVLVVLAAAVAGIFFVVQAGNKATVKTAEVVSEPLSVVVTPPARSRPTRSPTSSRPRRARFPPSRSRTDRWCSAGQLIATLDTDPLQVQAAQAEAGIAAGEAQSASASDQMPSRCRHDRGQRQRDRDPLSVQPRQRRLPEPTAQDQAAARRLAPTRPRAVTPAEPIGGLRHRAAQAAASCRRTRRIARPWPARVKLSRTSGLSASEEAGRGRRRPERGGARTRQQADRGLRHDLPHRRLRRVQHAGRARGRRQRRPRRVPGRPSRPPRRPSPSTSSPPPSSPPRSTRPTSPR